MIGIYTLSPIQATFFIASRYNQRACLAGDSVGEETACNAGELGSIPGLGRSCGEGNYNPLQYFCLENHMDRGGWQAI